MFQRITTNFAPARKRFETLNGRQHVAVPAVMLTVGVHSGSQGPLLYLPEELSKNPMTWNHKPVVLDHPSLNGEGISACDPAVVEAQSLGLLFNSGYDGRLKAEPWLDVEKANALNPAIMTAINNNQVTEVSTGLFHDLEVKEGTYNGEKYVGIVRNMQPDHLAILLNAKGACSVEKGAGLLRNADLGDLSYEDLREQLRTLLRGSQGYCYICDIYKDYVVFDKEDGKTLRVGYKIKKGIAALIGEPEEVRKKTSYVTANGEFLYLAGGERLFSLPSLNTGDKITENQGDPTSPQSQLENDPMAVKTQNNVLTPEQLAQQTQQATGVPDERKAQVSQLIGTGKWAEQDRLFLEGIPSEQFGKIAGSVSTGNPVQTPAQIFAQPAMNQQTPQTLNEEQAVEQWLTENNVPPAIRSMVSNSLNFERQEKDRLIKIITANKNNPFTPEFLKTKQVTELRGLAMLCRNSQPAAFTQGSPNYSGQGGVPMFLANMEQVSNQGNEPDAILPIPTLNWEDDQTKTG